MRSSAVRADSFCASNCAIRRRWVWRSSRRRSSVARSRSAAYGVAVVAGEFGEAPVDVGLVDRADALGRDGDLAQVVEGRREHLLRRGEVSGIGELAGIETSLQHVDQARPLLQQRIELLGRLRVGQRSEFVAQCGDLGGIDLLDAWDFELQLGEGSGRRHRERPRDDGQHREHQEHDHHERGRVDDLEDQPHRRAENDRCQPRRRVGEHRLAPTGHQEVRIARPLSGPPAAPDPKYGADVALTATSAPNFGLGWSGEGWSDDRNVPTAETSSKRTPPRLGSVNRGPLEGYTIGITADRRADEQMKLLAGRGAECLHGPVIKTHPVGSENEMRVATQLLLDNPPDLVIFTTGLGVRGMARGGRRDPARRRPP